MDFAWAVDALRRGLKVTRKGWLLTNSTMYLKMVKDAELDCNPARIFCMGRQASKWCPTQEQLFKFTDWEEYVEPRKEHVPGETPILQFIRETTGSSELPDGQTVEDQSDYAKEARKTIKVGEDTGYMAEQLALLADIYAEKISQRVAQLLQKTDVPLSKGDTNHA